MATGQPHLLSNMSGKKMYKCQTCPATFSGMNYLTIHSRIHTDIKPYKCSDCKSSFNCFASLRSHQNQVHRKQCDDDEEDQALLVNEESRRRLTTPGFPPEGRKPSHYDTNIIIKKRHPDGVPVSLNLSRAHTKPSLEKHLPAHKTQEKSNLPKQQPRVQEPKKDSKRCGLCRDDFNGNCSFELHTKVFQDNTQYTCSVCRETFTLFQLVLRHTQHGSVPVKCSICLSN